MTPEQKPAQPTTRNLRAARPPTSTNDRARSYLHQAAGAPRGDHCHAAAGSSSGRQSCDSDKPAPAAKPLKTDDPLALIMALSESERLALFT